MYRIAICDDEKSTCAEIESYILMYSKLRFIRNEIEVFYSGEAFCEYVKQGNFFDLLFLDIELPAINGIEVILIYAIALSPSLSVLLFLPDTDLR